MSFLSISIGVFFLMLSIYFLGKFVVETKWLDEIYVNHCEIKRLVRKARKCYKSLADENEKRGITENEYIHEYLQREYNDCFFAIYDNKASTRDGSEHSKSNGAER